MRKAAAGIAHILIALLPFVRCGGEDAAQQTAAAGAANRPSAAAAAVDPCVLLTPSEIAAAVGTPIERSEPSQQGGTQVCNFYGRGLGPVVSLVVAGGMPAMSSSADMAAWRRKQTGSFGDLEFVIEPIEGLGAPAIRNEVKGVGLSAVEAAVNGRLLIATTGSLEQSKTLVALAIARMP